MSSDVKEFVEKKDAVLGYRSDIASYSNLFLANALPEAVFKYLSKDTAFSGSEKAMYVINFQGLYFAVCLEKPAL